MVRPELRVKRKADMIQAPHAARQTDATRRRLVLAWC